MECVNIKLRVGNEMQMFSQEVTKRYETMYCDQGSKRFTYLAAQASLCMHFLKETIKRNDDWAWVPEYLEGYRTRALFEYEEAREEDDQETALPMLARLRFLTTLVRRISDSRRSLLFMNEFPHWDAVIGDNTVLRGLVQLMEESISNFARVEPQGNEQRTLMAAAQVYLAQGFLRLYWDLKDWDIFTDAVYDYIDTETERYNQARFEDDRDHATAMLARVRFATTLARRIDDPDRKAWLTLVSLQPGTMH